MSFYISFSYSISQALYSFTITRFVSKVHRIIGFSCQILVRYYYSSKKAYGSHLIFILLLIHLSDGWLSGHCLSFHVSGKSLLVSYLRRRSLDQKM